MTEQELVKWLKPNLRGELQYLLKTVDEADSLEELEKLQLRLRTSGKDLKKSIKILKTYLIVNKDIMNEPNI